MLGYVVWFDIIYKAAESCVYQEKKFKKECQNNLLTNACIAF